MFKNVRVVIFYILAALFFILFPYEIFEGKYGIFEIKLDRYEKLASFLSFPLSLISVILIYITYQSQKAETKDASSITKQQQFETTLFNLIQLKSDKLTELKVDRYSGTEALNYLLSGFFEEFKIKRAQTDLSDNVETGTGMGSYAIVEKFRLKELNFTKNIFLEYLEIHINIITPLIFIFNIINEHIQKSSAFSKNDIYLSLINSQLSKPEQLFILYYYIALCENLEDFDEVKNQIINRYKLNITILPKECAIEKHYHYFVCDINSRIVASGID